MLTISSYLCRKLVRSINCYTVTSAIFYTVCELVSGSFVCGNRNYRSNMSRHFYRIFNWNSSSMYNLFIGIFLSICLPLCLVSVEVGSEFWDYGYTYRSYQGSTYRFPPIMFVWLLEQSSMLTAQGTLLVHAKKKKLLIGAQSLLRRLMEKTVRFTHNGNK